MNGPIPFDEAQNPSDICTVEFRQGASGKLCGGKVHSALAQSVRGTNRNALKCQDGRGSTERQWGK